ncbi:hypothetical protein MBORA_14790 [Methanobrevibacter oralis]|uniref:DUF4391 domain-containing protein n=1 Tax=Methanobrevibacter oralis TaxID=66851 RepID=A0A166A4W2_METOA|nr:DUF4391 domain-containing protein [Methanobrevibacter oralis]KZX11571.1 hypothetical protein MBORA_14790 [Methanobrevibacter oralis]
MSLIGDILEVPNGCVIDYVIPKKEVFEAADLKTKDKKIFTDIVKQIKWCYKFDEDTLRISKYTDDVRNYSEVELININLKYDNVHKTGVGKFKEDEKIDRVVDILLRFIPYPIILTVQYENDLKFYGAHIRESKADSSKIVIDGHVMSTNWMDINNLSEIEEDFISKIQYDRFDKNDFYDFYDSYITAMIQYGGAMTAGGTVDLPVEEISKIYDKISLIDLDIKKIEKQISIENNFNSQLELNIKAGKLKEKKEKLILKLKGE